MVRERRAPEVVTVRVVGSGVEPHLVEERVDATLKGLTGVVEALAEGEGLVRRLLAHLEHLSTMSSLTERTISATSSMPVTRARKRRVKPGRVWRWTTPPRMSVCASCNHPTNVSAFSRGLVGRAAMASKRLTGSSLAGLAVGAACGHHGRRSPCHRREPGRDARCAHPLPCP